MKLLIAIVLLFVSNLQAQQFAFPGAEGWGQFSQGGRGGRTIVVSNLNASGAGSFRAACEASGPREVVFNVSGDIILTRNLNIQNPFISILAQTSPGGICVRNGTVIISTHDVVVRGLRVRNSANGGRGVQVAMPGRNVIIDHCSFSWAKDAMVATWDTVSNVTVQNCIIAEAIGESHSFGWGPGRNPDDIESRYLTNSSILRNLIAHGKGRNPKVHYHGEVANNLVYNWETLAAFASGHAQLDFIGNHYKRGPNSGNARTIKLSHQQPDLRIHVDDNRTPELPNGGGDQWVIVDGPTSHRSTTRRVSSGYEPFPSSQTMNHVIDYAGARPLDAVDVRIMNEVIQGTGSIKTVEGTYPVFTGTRTQAQMDALIAQHGGVDNWANSYYAEEEVQECTIAMEHPTHQEAKRISGIFTFSADVDCSTDRPIRVQFFLNDVLFFTDTEAPYRWTVDTRRFVDYKHRITMTVFDDTNPTSVSRDITLRNFSTE